MGWSVGDFLVAWVLLAALGSGLALALKAQGPASWRAGAALAVITGIALVWVNGAVGLVGSERAAINLVFYGLPVAGLAGAAISRFRARGMAVTMAALAAAQALAALAGLASGANEGGSNAFATVLGGAVFTLMWACSAALFAQAARRQAIRPE